MAGAARATRVPYLEVATDIRERIRSGRLAPGEKLGSLRALATEYDVAQGTVGAALEVLRDEGLIETYQSKGSFVLTAPAPPAPSAEYSHLAAEVAALRAEVQALSQRVDSLDRAELTEALGRIEGNLVELYGKTANEYPWEDLPSGARRPRAADEKGDRNEQRA